MSTARVPRDGDYLSPSRCVKLQGRRGVLAACPPKGCCTWCVRAVPKGRRTWCSQWCVDAYNSTQPGHQRDALRERDRGLCGSCGLDCQRRLAVLRRWVRLLPHSITAPSGHVAITHMVHGLARRGQVCSARQLGQWLRRRELWDVDHVVPIIEGGHPYDPRNLRTLCPWCHYRETAALAGRRADRRRDQDQQGLFTSNEG